MRWHFLNLINKYILQFYHTAIPIQAVLPPTSKKSPKEVISLKPQHYSIIPSIKFLKASEDLITKVSVLATHSCQLHMDDTYQEDLLQVPEDSGLHLLSLRPLMKTLSRSPLAALRWGAFSARVSDLHQLCNVQNKIGGERLLK